MNSFNNFKSKIIYILFFHIFSYKYLICAKNENIECDTLEGENGSFIKVKDYHNLSLIITTSKKIYKGIPPLNISSTTANININSSVATYNNNFILVSCLTDSFLTKININTGKSESLLNYSDIEESLEISHYSCSLSLNENIAYIAISQISSISVDKLIHKVIKINISEAYSIEEGPFIENKNSIKSFNFSSYLYQRIEFDRQILCETINQQLFCVHEKLEEENNYTLYGCIINDDFNGISDEKMINSFYKNVSFRLYKLNSFSLRILTHNYTYDIHLLNENNQNKISIDKRIFAQNTESLDLNTGNDFYDYNNNYLLKSSLIINKNYLFHTPIIYNFEIYQNNSDDHYELYEIDSQDFSSFFIYYNESIDKILIVYQLDNAIKYFILSNNKGIFNLKQYEKTFKIKSNDTVVYNISELIEANNYGKLDIYKENTILSNSLSNTNYYFQHLDNQILTIDGNQTKWLDYSFYFFVKDPTLPWAFIFSKIKLKIQICSFQCLNCTKGYAICDSCRKDGNIVSYAKLNNSIDMNCYPINQLIEGYIYDSSTYMFEPCFKTCQFCSKKGELSTVDNQNCQSCADGYYESYENQGNCKKKEGEIIFEACPDNKPYKINYTGECVDNCPAINNYSNFEYHYINFTEQENNILEDQYVKSPRKAFKYKLGNICYDECPLNTFEDENNICKYLIGCLYPEYKYYINDKKECVQNGCPEGYYQFNFQCFNGSCPDGTKEISSNPFKCESIYNYCYINETFQTICNNTKNNEYIYNYNNTKQYLKSCKESLMYTIEGNLTYLYNNTCYIKCPNDLLIEDKENGKCTCKFNGYYSDNNQFICFDNADACEDKFIVIDNINNNKECVNSLSDCIKKNYTIFNSFCYKNGCPKNTHLDNDNISCKCSYFFYNNIENNTYITCFDYKENCYSKGYLFVNSDTSECFQTLEECFIKDHLFYFNNNCYKSECPSGKILFSSIVNQTLKNEINNFLQVNESLENKLCVCDNILSINNLKNNGYNGTQICIRNPFEEFEQLCIQEIYPDEYFTNPEMCNFIYQNKCASYPPENTCITQNNPYLLCSVEIKLNMKIFNFICFENFMEIENNIKNLTDKNIPISTSPGIFIFAYYNKSNIEETNPNYSNLSFLYLNDCENLIKEQYNLLSNEKIYILGINTPDLYKNIPTNVYNYEIFLENGTKVENLSMCEGSHLTLSSPIINEELIHYKEAIYFASFGYDIYNRNDRFYTSNCAPASINNNDISLYDRYKDFYPSNVSLCNDSCKFSYINLTSKRIICLCEPFDYNKIKDEKDDYDMNYSHYLLSLINYKIIVCYKLFLNIENYYYNCGFFIGITAFIFCFIEFLVFMKSGIGLFHKQLNDNFPKQLENEKKERINTIKNNLINNNNDNISKIQNLHFKRKKTDFLIVNNSKYKNDLIGNPPKNLNIFNINDNGDYNNLDNSRKKINHNVCKKKVIKIVKYKKRSQSLHNRKKNICLEKSLNNDEKTKNISILDGLDKSKTNLKIVKNPQFINKNQIKNIKIVNVIDPLKNFNNYIIINDSAVDKKEINNVAYTQALRIDKRKFIDIYLSVLYNEIEAIKIFYYKNEYVHMSLTLSIYAFSELLDFAFNCFIYTEDEVSEKYHNNGSLKIFTSLSLSFFANILSNIIVFIISKLTNFSDILEIMIKDVRDPEIYKWNIERITKYTRIKLFFHYFIQLILIIFVIYYLFIFCAVYHNSQVSIALNYLYGALESLGLSVFLALITSIFRYLSLKYKISQLYNVSKYFYQHF